MSITKPPFIGREAEIAVVDELFSHIDECGGVVRIVGEPGIGKSTFLSVICERACERGFHVLQITGIQSESHLPFAGLHQALHPIIGQADCLPPPQKTALLSVFGMSDEAVPPVPNLFLVALASLMLLTECASRVPIVLAIDDFQWLDQPSYEVFTFLSRRIQSDPVIMLAAFREGFPHSLDENVPCIKLAELTEEASENILRAVAPWLKTSLRRKFVRQAAGNPLALVELPRGGGTSRADDASYLPLTERLERAFFGRVAELSPLTRTLLYIAAENDSASLPEILLAGKELTGENVDVVSLIPAVSANLIEIKGTEVHFRHPLIRSAIHQSIDLPTLQALHGALAVVTKDKSDRYAWHLAASTIEPDESIAEQLDEAARRSLLRGGVAMAAMVLENAARLSCSVGGKVRRLLHAAELAVELGDLDRMERLLREVELFAPSGAARARTAWIRELSDLGMVNDPARVSALLAFSRQAREAGEIVLAINLLWRAAQRCWWGNASQSVRDDIESTAAQLETSLTPAQLAVTAPQLVSLRAYVMPLGNSQPVFAKLKEFHEDEDANPVSARMLGSAANVIGAFDLGVGFLANSSSSLRDQGRLGDLARVQFALAWAQVEVGDWNGAKVSAEEGERLAEETERPHWIAAANIVKAKIAAMRGESTDFDAYSAKAERLALPLAASFLLAMVQLARGLGAISNGRDDEAFEQLQRIFDPSDRAYNSSLKFYALVDYVDAAVHTNRFDAARNMVDEVEHLAGGRPVPWVQACLSYAKAVLAPPEVAEDAFIRGFSLDLKIWPFLQGRFQLAYGTWLRRNRRPADARSPLRIARDAFDALGAVPWSERARQELRAAGEASRQRPDSVVDHLSPQELRIAQLAAAGLTNKEIAAKLYLSHRTVGYHLHRIFPKIGITSRAELRTAIGEMANQV